MTKITIKDYLRFSEKRIEDIPTNCWFLGGMNGDNLYIKTKDGRIIGIDTLADYTECKSVTNYQYVDLINITVDKSSWSSIHS